MLTRPLLQYVADVRVEEVQGNQEVHHQVDAWQEEQAVDVCDDVPTGTVLMIMT